MLNPNYIFSESAAAAQSQKNFWTRMSSTYRCIEVHLTKQQLIIKPQGIIGWMVKVLGFDLDHTIQTDQIITVKATGKWLDYGKVEVEFKKHKNTRKILLYLINHQSFISTARQTFGSKA
jgi:transposase